MLLPTLPDPEPGLAEGFADATVANYAQFRENDQTILDGVDGTFDLFFGRGVIEGTFTHPVVTAGTGLSANVGPLVALIGRVHVPASGTVLLPASTTSTIWLLQVGAQLVATNGTDPGTDENWSIVLGTATTDATHVTSRADTFAVVSRPGSSTAGGTVTSVGLSLPGSEFTVAGSPVTVAGTLSGSWKTQSAGKVLASPATGSPAVPTFRPIALSDLPAGVGPTTGIYNVVDFGADPTGTADTSPIVETLKAAIGTNGGGVIYYPPGLYWHSTGHVFTTRNLVLRGAGTDESVLEFSDDLAGAVPAPCLYWQGVMASSISLGADCNPGDRTITLVVGGALASALAVGDWIVLTDTLSNSTTTPNGVFHTRIQAISGDVLTLERRVPYLFQIAQTAIARYGPSSADCPHRLLQGAGISDCTVKVGPSSDGSGHRGTEHAPDLNRCVLVQFDYCDAPDASRVRAVGGALVAAGPVIPSGFVATTCNAPVFRDCDARDSGEQGVGYWVQYSTAARVVDCSTHQVGFGASAQRAAYCQIRGLAYHGRQAALAGRGAKLEYGCTLGEISGCHLTDAPFFGVYVYQSWDCSVDGNLIAYNGGPEISSPTLRHGIQSGGDRAVRNRIVNNTIKGHSGYGVSINPDTAGISTFCLVGDNFTDGGMNGVYLGGSDNDCKGNHCGSYGSGGVGVVGGASSARNRIQNNTFLNAGSGRSIQTDVSAGGNFIGGNTDDGLLFSPHPTDVLLDKKPTGDTLVVAASDSRDPTRADAGFRCDGTNDEVEIAAAVTAIAAKGGTVRLLEGTYNIGSLLNPRASNVTIAGQGPGTVLKRLFDGQAVLQWGDGATAYTGVVLRDFAIDGNKASYSNASNTGIRLTNATADAQIERVSAKNCQSQSFRIETCARIQLFACRSTGCVADAIIFNNTTDSAAIGCTSVSDGRLAWLTGTAANIRVEGCHSAGATGAGIYATGSRHAIVGNVITGAAAQGIFVDGGPNTLVSGNVVNACLAYGIRVRSADVTVIGNECTGNTSAGASAVTASRVLFEGNVCTGNTTYGIEIAADCTGIVLGPNRLNGNTTGAINDLSPITAAGGTRHVAQGGSVRSATAAFTASGEESLILADATTAGFNVTLPAASASLRNVCTTIKKTDSSANVVTIVGTVDGAANPTLTAQNQTLALICDGAAYRALVVSGAGGASVTGDTLVVSASDSIGPTRADTLYRCTGTNDHTTINAAITALGTKGGTVKLLEGTYNLAAAVTVAKSNVQLVGSGWGSVLKRGYNSGSAGRGAVEIGDGSTAYTGIVVRDLQIDGQKATQTSANNTGLTVLGSVSDSSIERVWVQNAAYNSFHSASANDRMTLTRCKSTGSGGYGYAVVWNRSEVSGNTSNGDVGGISFNNGGDQVRIAGNHVQGTTANYGMYLWGLFRGVVSGNVIHTTANNGVRIEGCNFVSFTGNFQQGATGYGCMIYNGADVTVTGNFFQNNSNSGVWVPGSSRTTLQGNHLLTNTNYGIEIRNDSTDTLVGPNTYNANTVAPIKDEPVLTGIGSRFVGVTGGGIYSKTAAYTLTGKESLVECDATTAAFAVTLPAAAGWMRGWRVTIKKVDSTTNLVTVTGTVDGTTNPTLGGQWQTMTLVCDGAAYRAEAGVAATVGGVIPIGGIILWSGSVASIPANWALCNGSSGTPDLRDRFVVGAGSTYAVAATGGASAHTHGLSGTAVVGSESSHTHPETLGGINTGGASGTTTIHDGTGAAITVATAHTHTTVPTSLDTSAGTPHSHTLSGSTDGASQGLPPYFSLAYIMRTS